MLRSGLLAALGVSIVLSSRIAVAATVTYSDGLLHTIPGDPAFADFDQIVLTNGSSLLALDLANVGGDPASAVPCSSDVIGAAALEVGPGSSASVVGAIVMSAGLQCEPGVGPILALHRVVGGIGADVSGEFVMRNGRLLAGIAQAFPRFREVARVEARSSAALHVRAGRARIVCCEVTSLGARSDGGSEESIATVAPAMIVEAGAVLEIEGGQTIGGVALANTSRPFADARAGGGAAIGARDSGVLIVRGGDFIGGFAQSSMTSSLGGNAFSTGGSALLIHDGSAVTIRGGTFFGETATADTLAAGGTATAQPGSAIRFEVDGSPNVSRIVILGGVFSGAGPLLEIPFTLNSPAPAPQLAHVHVAGGSFFHGPEVALRLAHPEVVTVFYMTDHAVDGIPGADPMSVTTGTLTGHLADGQPVSVIFERLNGAPLGVPEPVAGLPAALVALVLLARSPRRPSN